MGLAIFAGFLPLPTIVAQSLIVIVGVFFICWLLGSTVQRLHDLGHSSWYSLLFVSGITVGYALIYLEKVRILTLDISEPIKSTLLIAPLCIAVLWYMIEMGVVRGSRGANSYGPDPVGSPTERYAWLASRSPSVPGIKRSFHAGLARDLDLMRVHMDTTGEDLTDVIISRGPPFRLSPWTLFFRPAISAGVLSSLLSGFSGPYHRITLGPIFWLIIGVPWILLDHSNATDGWKTKVRSVMSNISDPSKPQAPAA